MMVQSCGGVPAEKVGRETMQSVINIYSYHVAYKLTLEAREIARSAREGLAPGNK
jgi:hypothetical protein